jgi:putative ABC transport system permease protein
MNFSDLIITAFSNLWKNKLRTGLTVFAVVIGATLISLMVSLGIGANDFVTSQFKVFMPETTLLVMVESMSEAIQNDGPIFGGQPKKITESQHSSVLGALSDSLSFTNEDITAIQSIPNVERVDASYMVSASSIRLEGSADLYEVTAQILPDYELATRRLSAGKRFEENDTGKIIISDQYLSVFGFDVPEEALGAFVIVEVSQMNPFASMTRRLPEKPREYRFEIVGVTEKNLASAEVFLSVRDGIEMAQFFFDNPLLYSEIWGTSLRVKVDKTSNIDKVAEEIRALGFAVQTPADIAASIQSVFRVIQVILSLFGIIALVVASFGIANTLIMSVYERTREIGIMKAVGATNGTIRMLFTVEAGLIGLLGGVLGILIGVALGNIVNIIAQMTILKDYSTFNISSFTWWLVLLVISVSTVVATLAGILPANRAANLDPIDALRYE